MQFLHLTFWDNHFWFWGEDSEMATDCRAIPGLEPEAPCHHPFALPAEAMEHALGRFPIDRPPSDFDTIFLRIPASHKVPFPSSPIITPPIDPRRKPILTTFELTGWRVSLTAALEYSAQCSHAVPVEPGLFVGPEFDWLHRLFRLAGSLAMQQSVLPSISNSDNRWEAHWTPLLQEDTQERLNELAASCPNILRCATSAKHQEALAASPARFARTLLDLCTDWFMRIGSEEPDNDSPSSPHQAWIHALEACDPVIQWPDAEEIRTLSTQVLSWRRPADLQARTPYRLQFRLEEPEENDSGEETANASWNVRCWLQSKDDPSAQLPIGAFLKPDRPEYPGFDSDPLEYILYSLGQAAGVFPRLAEALVQGVPESIAIDTFEAHGFLTETAPALHASGFGVVLPNWWRKERTAGSIGLRAVTGNLQATAGLSISALLDCTFQVINQGAPLSRENLKEIARLKLPLVRIRGSWVEVDENQIQKALSFLDREKTVRLSGATLLKIALGAEHHIQGLPVEEVETNGWLEELIAALKSGPEKQTLKPPKSFKGTLRPYQLRGFSWLAFLRKWGLGACLADDMGLGKTIQTLALLENDRLQKQKKPTLLVCPTSVVFNWKQECNRFTPKISLDIHHGPHRKQNGDFAAWAQKKNLIITTYGLLHRDRSILSEVAWAGVIIDEAQNIKNHQTYQARAAKDLTADYKIALTGTPVENHIGEMWSIMDFLNPDLLGSHADFKDRFFVPIQVLGREEAVNQLHAITSPFVMRRLKTDKSVIQDLPEKIEIKDYCRLTKEQASLYESVLQDIEESLEKADKMQRRGIVLSALTRLKQICNHPAHFLGDQSRIPGRSGKLIRLQEMIEEFRQEGDQAIIFTQYKEMGDLLMRFFQETLGCHVPFLHGGLNRKKRTELIEDFQNPDNRTPLFILSLKAGGTGINLTNACRVVHFDRWWNPAVENQATDRAFRIGQTRQVMVHKFVCAGTLEERIDKMIDRKAKLASQVVKSGERWISELSNEELKALWALDPDAVGD